ncbi:MAG TPA: hypothetical protein VNO51_23950 [Ilumatobacteraceae bacterium]|nr:hypothetical protein [Ilumatobacteraceae bacterium]
MFATLRYRLSARRVVAGGIAALVLAAGATAFTLNVTGSGAPTASAAPVGAIDFARPLTDDSRRGTYLGAFDAAPDVFVAITTDEGLVRVYVCDGASFGHWFGGELYGNSFDLVHDNGARVTGAISNGRAVGRYVAPDGSVSAFTASLPLDDGGLFRADETVGDQRVVAGWIVHDDGEVRGVSTVQGAEGSETVAAPPIDATQIRDVPTETLPVAEAVPVVEVTPASLTAPEPTVASADQQQRPEGVAVDAEPASDSTAPPPAELSDVPPTLTATFTPPAVRVGESSTWSGTLTNSGKVALVDVGFGLAFPDPVVPTLETVTTDCDGSALAVDPKVRLKGDPQVVATGITLGAGATCTVSVDVVPAIGAFKVVTSPPTATNAPTAGPVAAAVIESVAGAVAPAVASSPASQTTQAAAPAAAPAGPKVPDSKTTAIAVAPDSKAGAPLEWTASADFGSSPFPVTLTPGEQTAKTNLSEWSIVFSDGTGQAQGTGPLIPIPHTFVNDGREPVVFHADLTAKFPDGSVTRSRLSFTVTPAGLVTPALVADVTTAAQRGKPVTVPVRIVNPGNAPIAGATVKLATAPATSARAAATGWTCTGVDCKATANIAPFSASPPLQLTIDLVPLDAPTTITVSFDGTAKGSFAIAVEGFQAEAGPDQTVDAVQPISGGGTAPAVVILDGSNSTSSIGRPRTFTWRQVAGPAVTLDPGADPSGQRTTFAAPQLTRNETLEFELTVADGVVTDTDRVRVTVLRANAAPTVTIDTGAIQPDRTSGAIVPAASAKSVELTAKASDPDGDAVTVAWTVVDVPAAKITTSGQKATLTWPIAGRPIVVVEVKATDALGRTAVDTIAVGTAPAPLTLAATSTPSSAPGGSVVQLTATPSRTSGVQVAWSQVAGPPVTFSKTTGAATTMTLPATVLGPETVVVRATATASDGATPVTQDVTVLATEAPPLSVVLAPSQTVAKGATVRLTATIGGPTGATVQWTRLAGPDVTFASPTKPATTFAAPRADTVVVVRVTVTAGNRTVTADQVVNVGTIPPAAPVSGCTNGSVLDRVFKGERVLLLGSSSTVLLGDVTGAVGTCSDTVVNHSATGINLFGFIIGDDLAGTIDGTKICFTSGTIELRSEFDLPPIELGSIPLCVVFASLGSGTAGPSGFAAPLAMRRQDAGCDFPLTGELRWPGEVPFVDLPAGFTPGDTVLAVGCDELTLTGSATVDSGGTLQFDGAIGANGSGTTSITADGLELFGGTVGGSITVQYGSSPSISGSLDLVQPDFGIDGLTVERIGLGLANGTLRVTGRALVGDAEPRLAINLDGSFTSPDDFAVTVAAAATSAWQPAPGLNIAAASFTGRFARSGSDIDITITGAMSGAWSVAPGVTVRQVSVQLTNAAVPEGCAGLPAGSLFIAVGGAADIAIPNRNALQTQIQACLGLPGTSGAGAGQPAFTLRSVTTLPALTPDPAVDMSIDRLELRVEYIGGELAASLRGDARVLGLSISARLLFTTSPSGDVLVAIATGDLAGLGLPIATGSIVFATASVDDVEIDDGVVVDVDAGLSVIATIDLGQAQRKLLNDVLKPPTPIQATLIVSATLGGPTITFTAAIDFGPNGIELFKTCPTGNNCNPNDVNTTRFQLNSGFLKLMVGAAGFQLGVGGEGTLFLPPAETKPGAVRSEIDLALEAFFRPPAEVGISFSLLSEEGWVDAVGIDGLTVNALVVQGSIDFTVPISPVPSIGILAEVSSLPDDLADLIGYTNNGEPLRMALNIAPKNPIIDITIGEPDGEAVLRPLAPLDGSETDLDDAFTVDHASLVFAPLGGAIGPITYSPGVSLRFGATVLGTSVEINATIDIAGLRLIANVDVGPFAIGGVTVSNTQLLLDIQPLGMRLRIAGGVSIPNGPQLAAVYDVQAGVLAAIAPGGAPLPSTSLPRPTAGLSVVADLSATTWNIAPGTSVTNLKLHAEAALDAVSATFDATFSAKADATIMGHQMILAGDAKFAGGEFQEVHMRFNPGTISVAGVSFGGDGRCQASLVAAPTTVGISGSGSRGSGGPFPGGGLGQSSPTTTVPRLGTSGPCFQLDYVAAATPPVAIGFNASISAGSVKATVKGVVDAAKADIQGTVALGELGSLDIAGVLYHGSNSSIQNFRIKIRDEATGVQPQQGSWRIDGEFAQGKALKGINAPWSFSMGSVDPAGSPPRVTWAQLSGEISRPGFFVKIKGEITFVGTQMRYTLIGESALKVNESSTKINPNPDALAAPAENTLHAAVRTVVFTLDPSPASHQQGLEQTLGRLYGSASYTLEIELRHDQAPSFEFAGTAQVLYSEAFKRGSATSFVEESPRSKWNVPLFIDLEINSNTGTACFRWGEPGEFGTIKWGSCP